MPIDFRGHRVVSFASRRADLMCQLIEQRGGQPLSAPTMRKLPLERNTESLHFTDRLLDDQFDVVIFLTGVGTHMLAQIMALRVGEKQLAKSLNKLMTVARGPKPDAALRQIGVEPTLTVPLPGTWQEVLTAMDDQSAIEGRRVAVQEYGRSNPELIDGLIQRGANVYSVPVYRWQLPEDVGPVRDAIEAIATGRADFVMFTNSTQIHHLFEIADSDGNTQRLLDGFKRVCIGSVGPMATRAVGEHGMTVDFESDCPQMSDFVRELARRGHDLLAKKRKAADLQVDTNRWKRIDMLWAAPKGHGPPDRTIHESVFMQACRCQRTPYTPIWLMRQIGRYQRAYRQIKSSMSFLELCKNPQLSAELTLMAVDQLGVDAAIIFTDLLPIVETMGMDLAYIKGSGPVFKRPLRKSEDVRRLAEPDLESMGYVFEALRITRKALRPDLALIGFAGAPFTIASYMIEGGKSSQFMFTKSMMYRDPKTWHSLMDRLACLLTDYLNRQIEAGADAVQLFDSWVGTLGPDDYREYVLPHVQRLIAGVNPSAPLIHFATGNPALLPPIKQAGGDVIGLDWRVDLAEAWALLGHDVAIMGNLDPIALYAEPEQIRRATKTILEKAAGRPGHIFNLGHGILPTVQPEHVAELVDAVHELSRRETDSLERATN